MKRKLRTVWRIFMAAICVVLLGLAVAITAAGLWMEKAFAADVDLERFAATEAANAPPVFYRYRFTDRANRVGEEEQITEGVSVAKTAPYAPYREIPEDMIHAIVAIEDKRFFEHRGVDWYRTAAAGLNYVLGFSDRFGASTITQQLVKNVTGENEVSVRRKVQEVFFARDLERSLDKTEILERYLNILPLSDGCRGISEGALRYFGKSVSELTLPECATIAAITNQPSYYNPFRHPDHAIARRNLILTEMERQGYLEADACEAAKNAPLELRAESGKTEGEPIRSWYLDMVIDDVIADLSATYGMTREAASRKALSGGLRIDVAMDEEIQKYVENYYRAAVETPKNAKGESAQSALIVIDAKTGDILGVAGAVGEKTANRLQNFATQTKRPPGSAIKPITVYGPALELGKITWSSVYDDVPVEFGENGNRPWPRNGSGYYRGLTNISFAVAQSVNTVAVRVLQDVGLRESFRFAREKFHLESLLENGEATDCNAAALALGQMQYGTTLRELTAAYTVFADGGVYHPYRSYFRVTDANGKTLLSCPDRAEAVLSEGNAAVMTKLLQGVVQHGTSSSVTLDKICECAGKTGTSQDDRDRWFIGYTPDVICGVWCGFEYPEPVKGNNPCTAIWNRVMHRVVELRGGRTAFAVPNNVIRCAYCKDSGKLPAASCALDPRGNRGEAGWFVKGTEPSASCDRHIPVEVDQGGGVCHGKCPVGERKTVSLLRVTRHFPMQVTVSDAQYVFRGVPYSYAPNAHSSEAYFEAGLGDYCGRSATKLPFNRSCAVHTGTAAETTDEPAPAAPAPWEEPAARLPLPWENAALPPKKETDEA